MGMLYTYLWTFFLFAFLGWCSEVVFAAIRQRRFVNRGFLNGPLCPIYGIGVVAIDFLLRPFQGNLPVLLVGGMLLGSARSWKKTGSGKPPGSSSSTRRTCKTTSCAAAC